MSAASTQSAIRRDRTEGPFASTSNFLERLPMLRVVFERMATVCTEDLRNVSVSPPQLTLQSIDSGIAGDMLSPLEGASVFGVLHAPMWDAHLIVSADRSAVFTLVEMLLGGDGSEPLYATERPFSKVEMRIAGTFFQRLAQSLSASFASIAASPLVVEGTADRIDFDAIGRRNNSVVVAKFRLELRDRGGEILVAIPRSVFTPMRQALSRIPSEETTRADPRWTQQIQNEITRTNVVLRAVLDECWISLDEISSLEVGRIMRLNATPHSRVRVECNDEPLLWCQLGKSNGVYTLRVDQFVDREQEFLDDILFG